MKSLQSVTNLSNKLILGLSILSLIESLEEFQQYITMDQAISLERIVDEVEATIGDWPNSQKTPEQYIETIMNCIPVIKEWSEEYEALERGDDIE